FHLYMWRQSEESSEGVLGVFMAFTGSLVLPSLLTNILLALFAVIREAGVLINGIPILQ
uniref:Anoctamin n=2 Tax=Strongyloides papillosus TaxID=174720 RepID=A0A0N5C6H6_STREA